MWNITSGNVYRHVWEFGRGGQSNEMGPAQVSILRLAHFTNWSYVFTLPIRLG